MMDGEGLEMFLESASVSTVSLADPALEGITSRGPSSIDLDEQLKEIVPNATEDSSQEVNVVPDDDRDSCESMTLGDEVDPDALADFSWSESGDEVYKVTRECIVFV